MSVYEFQEQEINELRARLAEVEAERDARPTWDIFGGCLSQETKRRKAAEARLAEVIALCSEADRFGWHRNAGRKILAAARGEGDQ